ncbi:MAG: GIN domain-containing protein [Caulobacterales bacterium]
MIRVLVMIAVTGFLVSVVTLSTAIAIGGPDLLTEGAMNGWRGGHWGWSWSDDDQPWSHGDRGAQATRDVAWTGGDTLDLDVPADVTYTQAPGAGKLVISGPQREVANVEVRDGHVRFAHHGRRRGDLTIVMTAPAVTRFNLSGSGKLAIEGYDQDKLSVDVSGDADVSATGQAKTLALSISGSGAADFTGLKVADANLDLDGSGDATLAPTGSATINISGSGDVTLLSRPARLESNVSGSGSIHQKDGPASSAPPPSPGPAPKARRART